MNLEKLTLELIQTTKKTDSGQVNYAAQEVANWQAALASCSYSPEQRASLFSGLQDAIYNLNELVKKHLQVKIEGENIMSSAFHDYFTMDCSCNPSESKPECQTPLTCLALSCDRCPEKILDGQRYYMTDSETLCCGCARKDNCRY